MTMTVMFSKQKSFLFWEGPELLATGREHDRSGIVRSGPRSPRVTVVSYYRNLGKLGLMGLCGIGISATRVNRGVLLPNLMPQGSGLGVGLLCTSTRTVDSAHCTRRYGLIACTHDTEYSCVHSTNRLIWLLFVRVRRLCCATNLQFPGGLSVCLCTRTQYIISCDGRDWDCLVFLFGRVSQLSSNIPLPKSNCATLTVNSRASSVHSQDRTVAWRRRPFQTGIASLSQPDHLHPPAWIRFPSCVL
jgi:hypothetical protein